LKLLATLFGGGFTLASAYGFGRVMLREAPPEIALAVGAAVESVLIFILVSCGLAAWPAFLALGLAGVAAAVLRRGAGAEWRIKCGRIGAIIFLAYGVFYLVNAAAPEIWADGFTYHLAAPQDILRTGGFPARVRFYDLIPQGIEMLFTMAFAFGRAQAARLVEFGLFAAGVPLIFRLGARLGMSSLASLLVAVFYFTAPLIGLTGASSYNDAALVFLTLAVFWLLLDGRIFAAGLAAGFCYAIKLPGGLAIVWAALFLLLESKRRVRAIAILAAGAAITVAPWLIRGAIMTGNPFAPMMNAWFPNPYFYLDSERGLAAAMRYWQGIPAVRVPWELAFGGALSGVYGPLIFALPLAFLALRTRAGRWCVAAACLLAIAWVMNTGARFLMPAAVVAMFAVAMPLPRAALWVGIAVQSLVCFPPVLNLWQNSYFRLHEFPLRAALGLTSEADYLTPRLSEYRLAKMIERATPPDARIFSIPSVAAEYVNRDILVRWHSAEAERIFFALQAAFLNNIDWVFDWKGSWPERDLRAIRFRAPAANREPFDAGEVHLLDGDRVITPKSNWALRAWPNVWDAPLAFDRLRTTAWNSHEPLRPGMFLEVDLGSPQRLTGATLLSHTPLFDAPLEMYGQGIDGKWQLLDGAPKAVRRRPEDLRFDAISTMRHAGYSWLVVDVHSGPLEPLGRALADNAAQWGLRYVAEGEGTVLLRVW